MSMTCCSTPAANSAASFTAASQGGSLPPPPPPQTPQEQKKQRKILEEVARLTLNEPQTPDFQTPLVRKRKQSFSFVVTPPRALVFPKMMASSSAFTSCTSKPLPPMLPNSSDLDAGGADNLNPFTRHRPLHSPFGGVSAVNMDFVVSAFPAKPAQQHKMIQPAFATTTPPPQDQATTVMAMMPLPVRGAEASFHLPCRTQTCTKVLGDIFPDLTDNDMLPRRALKMRRQSRDELPLFFQRRRLR